MIPVDDEAAETAGRRHRRSTVAADDAPVADETAVLTLDQTRPLPVSEPEAPTTVPPFGSPEPVTERPAPPSPIGALYSPADRPTPAEAPAPAAEPAAGRRTRHLVPPAPRRHGRLGARHRRDRRRAAGLGGRGRDRRAARDDRAPRGRRGRAAGRLDRQRRPARPAVARQGATPGPQRQDAAGAGRRGAVRPGSPSAPEGASPGAGSRWAPAAWSAPGRGTRTRIPRGRPRRGPRPPCAAPSR